MRLAIINSNTSAGVTELVAREAKLVASPETEIIAVTAALGPATIESRAEASIAAYATLLAIAEQASRVDAALIACFSDPGLYAARELFPFPVTGIAESAMLVACQLGSRFSIVTVGKRSETSLHELVRAYGFEARLASIRTLEKSVATVAADQSGSDAAFADLCDKCVTMDGADVVILGGAVMAGMPRRISEILGIPVLDGVSCGIKQAELLHSLGLAPSLRRGSFQSPPNKQLTAVPEPLVNLFRCP